jgi:hypothetical protein
LKVTFCENGGTSMVYVLFHSTFIPTVALKKIVLTLSQGLDRMFVEWRLVGISKNNNNSRGQNKFTTISKIHS